MLYVYKFIIRPDDWRKLPDSTTEVSGYVAATVAETENDAKDNLRRYGSENGLDARWLDVADAIRLPVQSGTFIAWACR